jgi:hypothetical protein
MPQQQQQYQQNNINSPSVNPYPQLNSYVPQQMYPPPSNDNKRHRPTISTSSDESAPTPKIRTSTLKVPKFERTYTDALEDELFDESSSTASQSANSQNQISRHPAPGFTFPRQYTDHLYMDKTHAPSPLSHLGRPTQQQQQQQQHQQQHQQQQQQQSQGPSLNVGKLVPNVIYTQPNGMYDPLKNRQDSQQMLSSTAVADSVRRLQAPNRTTVSPREAFLDYPDSADFRERALFSNSTSPYSKHAEPQEMSRHQEGESCQSNDDDYTGSEDNTLPLPPSGYQTHTNVASLSIPQTSRSNSTSTGHSAVYSGDISGDSGASSESEYDPQGTSERRPSRSSARPVHASKTFACPECGKRFEKGPLLQTHRRNAHGRGNGPPVLSQHKFSNSHRCDWVDPVTGKSCNTIFSRP